jgi:uncharacterized damage-inducible protein DinB
MKNYLLISVTTLALLVAAACGGTTTPPEAENTAAPASAPAPAAGGATVRGDLLADWREQKDMMLKAADAMPEDKFGFKSTPPQRSYGEQVMHIASTNVDLLKMVGGQAAAPTFTADSAKTKADMLKALAESYDYGIALLEAQPDAWATETIDAGFLGQATRARVFWFLLGHSMDTYGQMVVYLRLNGVVPPASRGV